MSESVADDANRESIAEGARALARLHQAQMIESADPHGAYADFVAAGAAFEHVVQAVDVPAFRQFLARARVGEGRYHEALGILEVLCALDPTNADADAELSKLRAEARHMVVKRAVGAMIHDHPPSAEAVVAANLPLLDLEMQRDVHATATHYADRSDQTLAEAMRTFCSLAADLTGNEIWNAVRLESAAVHEVARFRPFTAIADLRSAEEIYESLDRPEFVACARNHLGLALTDVGQFAEAEELFDWAIRYHTGVGDDIEAARVAENLASAALKSGDHRRAVSVVDFAIEALDRRGRPDLAMKARRLLAQAMSDAGDLRAAVTLIDRVVAFGRQAWADQPELLASALTTRGYILEALGRLSEAHGSIREAEQLLPASRTAQAPQLRPELSGVHSNLNDYEAAIDEETRRLERHVQDGLAIEAARARLNLAQSLVARFTANSSQLPVPVELMQADVTHALELLDEAIEDLQPHRDHPLLVQVRRQKAVLLGVLGNPSAIHELVGLAYDLTVRGEYGATASILQNLSALYLSQGRLSDAGRVLLIGERYSRQSHDPSLTWDLRSIRAQLESLQGDTAAAAGSYRWLIDNYAERENAVGSPEFVVGWSRNKSALFAEALAFFVAQGEVEEAFQVSLAAKARTHQAAASSETEPARRTADVALMLKAD